MCPTPPNDQDEIGAVLALAISAVASLVGIWPLGVVVSGTVSSLSNCESFSLHLCVTVFFGVLAVFA